MHVTAQGHLETLYTAISIKVVGLFQAYVTRPKGSVGSCKYVLVSQLSAVGQTLRFLSASNKWAPCDYCQRQS